MPRIATLTKLVRELNYTVDTAAVAEAILARKAARRLVLGSDLREGARSRAASAYQLHRRSAPPPDSQP